MSKGLVPKDQETLRQISSLISNLPAADSKEFRQEYMTVCFPIYLHYSLMSYYGNIMQEHSDVLLTSYLAAITKELGPFNDVRVLILKPSLTFSAAHRSLLCCTQRSRPGCT